MVGFQHSLTEEWGEGRTKAGTGMGVDGTVVCAHRNTAPWMR